MSKRYTYSRQIVTAEGLETFTAVEFDAFDEAIKIVDRGISDRKLEVAERSPGVGLGAGLAAATAGGSGTAPAPQKVDTIPGTNTPKTTN